MKNKDFDLIITTNNKKKEILKKISQNKGFLTCKIITLNEFKKKYFGDPSAEALYYLLKTKNISIDVAKVLLKNAYFIKPLWNELINNDLIIFDKYFKKSFKKVLILNIFDLDPYIKKELDNYDSKYILDDNKLSKPDVYEFTLENDEIWFVATKIIELLNKGINPNNIKLVNITSDYVVPLKRIFKLFNIPFALNEKKSIYKTKVITEFFKKIKEQSLSDTLASLDKNDTLNILIDTLNKYGILETDEFKIEILKDTLKNTYKEPKKYKTVIECLNFDEITNDDKYYFVLGFNEGSLPKIMKDEDYLSDEEKLKFGILTSFEKNKINKLFCKNKIQSTKNIVLTYRLKSTFNEYLPSTIINELNLNVIKDLKLDRSYSNTLNILDLGSKLDKLIKYNEYSKDLDILNATYKNSFYKTYDNKFKGITISDFYEFTKNKILLSYSSMDNYYKCSFRYYIQNILRLVPYEETFAIIIGNLFHLCLSKMYEPDFDLDMIYENFIKEKVFKADEQFFVKKLKNDLKFVINSIHKQEENSDLTKVLTEQKIIVEKNKNIEVTFMGIIDKIKYAEFDGKKIMAIIDYKTGNLETNIDNINYGLHLQLPVYIYLTKKEYKNVEVAGFYLQRILNQDKVDEETSEVQKKLKLDGFSTSNLSILKKFDSEYENSRFIKSLKMSANGWYSYAKVLNENDIDTIAHIAEEKIDEAIINILCAKFYINPKRINNELEGCKYCKFQDICFRKEEDIIDLKYQKIKDILGGEDNAKLD